MFVTHHARLDAPSDSGTAERDRLLVMARRGDPRAVHILTEYDYPHEVHYLREWALELNGEETVSFTAIRDWARLTGRRPAPHQVLALKRVCDALRVRGEPDAEDVLQ